MRIISPFHDYYDSAMATGTDERSVFLRRPEGLALPTGHALSVWDHPLKPWVQRAQASHAGPFGDMVVGRRQREKIVEPGLVLFAGRAYPFMAVQDLLHDHDPTFVWSLNELMAWLAVRGEKLEEHRRYWGSKKTERQRMEEWFAYRGADATDAMAKAQVAIALIEDHSFVWGGARKPGQMIINPRLEPYGFARQLDPWTAYQELSMFVEGVLRHPDPVTEPISDQDRLVQHGFDHWSFRKLPEPSAPRKTRRAGKLG